tara:strand:- start:64 stop:219 length:156 start_codon:yes stop_codon:yes gene_type:complete
MYYPNTLIRKEELIRIFQINGYSILLDSIEGNGVYGKSNYGCDLIFLKSQT